MASPEKLWIAAFTLFIFPIIAFFLFHGGIFGMTTVATSSWGGLMLTLILSIVGIVAALASGHSAGPGPALGDAHREGGVRGLIELWRGVPLITVLFMASVMLPLFLPAGVDFDKLLRALVGIALFQSAYVAEVVRADCRPSPRGRAKPRRRWV